MLSLHANIPVERKQGAKAVVFDIFQFITLILILCWITSKSVENLGYYWQWEQVTDFLFTIEDTRWSLGPLLEGLLITLKISAISLILSFFIGLLTAILRLSDSNVGKLLATIYLEISRNTPLLIQIFFIYFVLGPILDLERFTSAIIALSLFEGAYASEIFRAGIISIDKGQHEAAVSSGLSTFARYRYIILPQALRNVTPPLTSQAISLIKDSALVSTIAIYDLTMQAQALVAETYLTFEIWFTVAVLYLCINIFLSLIVNVLEYRNRRNI
ncbi:MAG: amino acid ABC transporter permease [Desulfotalea sp.]